MTVPATGAAEPGEARLRPSPDDLVDIAFASVLAGLGVIGFRSSFGGGEELTVGIPAVLAGGAVGYVAAKLRLPLLLAALTAVVVFFLLGGVLALRSDAIAGLLPSFDVLEGLVDGAVNGWARLLTTVPPAGEAGNLLAVPYLAGFAGGVLSLGLAIALPRWPACVAPPAVVLGLSVLLGVRDPASLLLQGALFGALTVGWLCLRVRRVEPALVAGGRRRVASGVVMLGLAGVAAFGVGPNLPGAGAHDRYLLRDRFEPPFDPSQFPSPLARFRRFHGADASEIQGTLFTVKGLPEGEAVRFAVMDDYDGYVWRASKPNQAIGGNYLRVGEQIPGAVTGEKTAAMQFEMGTLADVDSIWVPTAGSPTSITFQGNREDALTESFRFNRVTETAASPDHPREGDRWTVVATFPDGPGSGRLSELPVATSVTVAPPLGLTDAISARITRILKDSGKDSAGPYDKLNAIAEYLKAVGGYTDGVTFPHPAGHGLTHLVGFWARPQPVGNGEQYAAGLAYAARALGIPSRVVFEFRPQAAAPGEPAAVLADDAVAVVEILLTDAGWVRLADPTPPEDNKPDAQAAPTVDIEPDPVQPPPPTTVAPRAPLPSEGEHPPPPPKLPSPGGSGGILGLLLKAALFAAVPLVLLGGPALVVVALKHRRRLRRRTAGDPGTRIAAGWTEVVDLARDTGAAVPPRATRLEIARFFPAASAGDLAAAADVHVFGRDHPTEADAEAVWRSVDAVRADLLGPLKRTDRVRAAVSLTSLRAGT